MKESINVEKLRGTNYGFWEHRKINPKCYGDGNIRFELRELHKNIEKEFRKVGYESR